MTISEIPISLDLNGNPYAQEFSIVLSDVTRILRFTFLNVDNGNWVLDIYDRERFPLLQGLYLISDFNLLEQFAHLNLGGSLFVVHDRKPATSTIAYNELGVVAHVYWWTL